MIPLDRAVSIVLDAAAPPVPETVPVAEARGRVLAEVIRADRDSPPFDRSAMDGFALRAADAAAPGAILELREDVAAGTVPERPVGPGYASRIFTGAQIPEGADAVQMVEKTELVKGGTQVRVLEAVRPGEHIRRRGEEVRAGQEVLYPGVRMGAPEIGYLSWVGRTEVAAYRRTRVGILVTGDELVEPDRTPAGAQIRNSNGPMLAALVEETGGVPVYLGIAADERGILTDCVEKGLENDLLLVSGGVSVGDRDFVEEVLERLGVSLGFRRVAIKPGKPGVFGTRGGHAVFGLPGNPVSCLVLFHWLVAPLLRKMSGQRKVRPPVVRAALRGPLRRHPQRFGFHQARLEPDPAGWTADPLPTTGSGDLLSCARANAMILAPSGEGRIEAGETVDVLLVEGFAYR